ncbi:hypothetical protein E2C01_052282 [Portunus trituberculatus]|uniref:Uncharacterized protein n=1 Tax=Portunus trituberculatus TaxID=210409 RepID=A0A5B7GL36_PORTR|nr:hypothetical protein [Portunus trituberculatus]
MMRPLPADHKTRCELLPETLQHRCPLYHDNTSFGRAKSLPLPALPCV